MSGARRTAMMMRNDATDDDDGTSRQDPLLRHGQRDADLGFLREDAGC